MQDQRIVVGKRRLVAEDAATGITGARHVLEAPGRPEPLGHSHRWRRKNESIATASTSVPPSMIQNAWCECWNGSGTFMP